MFDSNGAITVPGKCGSARTAPRFMVRRVRATAWVVGILKLPDDYAIFDKNIPRTRSSTIHTVCRSNFLVILPSPPVEIFPFSTAADQFPPIP